MRFAYLIMAHHRFDVLKLLLNDLDDVRNDIYLHIDSESEADIDSIKACVTVSRLVCIRRRRVYWGDVSQIECVIDLLKASVSDGYHDYYHFLAGVELPVPSQDAIHRFFEAHQGKEFIGFDTANGPEQYLDRVMYRHYFRKYERRYNRYTKRLLLLGERLLARQIQKGKNRIRGHEDYYRKGDAKWSVTHDLALHFIARYPEMKPVYRWSYCGDELFFQTEVYHSRFYENVYNKEDEFASSMRYAVWTGQGRLTMQDVVTLIQSGRLFARKFESEDAAKIFEEVARYR